MPTIIRILVIGLLVTGSVLTTSFLWPKITTKKPPEPIERIREKAEETKIGKGISNILGEESQNRQEEQKIPQEEKEGKSLIQTVTETIKERITETVVQKSGEEIIKALETLPPEQFKEVKKQLCGEN